MAGSVLCTFLVVDGERMATKLTATRAPVIGHIFDSMMFGLTGTERVGIMTHQNSLGKY